MELYISPSDTVPCYKQIVEQVGSLIASGILNPGDALPPVRELAGQLLVNPNTVARAYRELNSQGMLESRQGCGTVVTEIGPALARTEHKRILVGQVDRLIGKACQLGLDKEAILKLINDRHTQLARRED